MQRKFLSGLGLEPDIIDKIMEQNGADIEREKAVVDGLRAEIAAAKSAESEAKRELTDFKSKVEQENADKTGENEAFKSKYEAELAAHTQTKTDMQKEFDDFKTGVETEKTAAAVRGAVISHLKSKGANQTALEKEMFQTMLNSQIDPSKAKFSKDGSIENIDDLSKPFVEGLDFMFGTVETKGADVANPPNGEPPKTFTMEQIKSMTADEINKNWAQVQETLKKGN